MASGQWEVRVPHTWNTHCSKDVSSLGRRISTGKKGKFWGFFEALIGLEGIGMMQWGLATGVLRSKKSYSLHTRSTISLGRIVTNLTLDIHKQLCELLPMLFLLLSSEFLLILNKLLFPSTLLTLPNNIYQLFLTRKEATSPNIQPFPRSNFLNFLYDAYQPLTWIKLEQYLSIVWLSYIDWTHANNFLYHSTHSPFSKIP